MKIKVILLSILSVMFFSCESTPQKNTKGAEQTTHENHDGHNHDGHDHSGHDHSTEKHEHGADCDHDHSDHKHSDENQAEHKHGADCDHDHSDHKHSAENHAEHKHGADCDHGHQGHDYAAESKSGDAHNHGGNEIVLAPAQAKELGLTYHKIAPHEFASTIRTSGVIEATPGDDAVIAATASGIISFGGRKIVEGVAVNRGGALVSINSSNLADDNLAYRVTEAQAAYRKAKADLARIEDLHKDQMATAQALEEARYAESITKKSLETLTRNTNGGVKTVTSPLGGFVTSLAVRDGDFVSQGDVIATVSSNRTVVLKADLPARHFDKLGTISSANFSTPYNRQVYDISKMNGRKLATARTANSYSLPIRFEIDNRDGLIAGSVVDVFLKTESRTGVIAIPTVALTEEQGAYYVYIKLDDECYEKRNVTLGQSNGSETEILRGLHTGETIVARGAYFVRLAATSATLDPHAGHSH